MTGPDLGFGIGVVGGIAGVVGVWLTVHFGRKTADVEEERSKLETTYRQLVEAHRQLEESRRKLDWEDLRTAAADLRAQLKTRFQPDLIFTPSLRGATFANLLTAADEPALPVIVGMACWNGTGGPSPEVPGHVRVCTPKWTIHVPENLGAFRGKKVLLVEDLAITGDLMLAVRAALEQMGFRREDLRTMCVVSTHIAIHSNKGPDFHWMTTSDDGFYFPWGRAK